MHVGYAPIFQNLDNELSDSEVYAQELRWMCREKQVPSGDVPQGFRVNVSLGIAHGRMQGGDAGILQPLKIRARKAARIALPAGKLLIIQGEQAQHVNHSGLTDQIQRAR